MPKPRKRESVAAISTFSPTPGISTTSTQPNVSASGPTRPSNIMIAATMAKPTAARNRSPVTRIRMGAATSATTTPPAAGANTQSAFAGSTPSTSCTYLGASIPSTTLIVLASATSSIIHSTPRSVNSQRMTSRVETTATPPSVVGAASTTRRRGRKSKTRDAESQNSSPATTTTGVTPNARTSSGATSPFPIMSPVDAENDRNDVAEASSSSLATSGRADASDGCETWCRTRTANSTSRSEPKPVPKKSGISRQRAPIVR